MLRRLRAVFPAKLSIDTLEEGIIPSLDGLRGLAILMVIGFHYLRSYFPIGWAGVDLFFVLSGFLITRILLQSKEKYQAASYFRNFYARRILRIFPLYYVFLGIVLFGLPAILGNWYGEDAAFLWEKQGWFWTYMENWLFAFRGWGDSTLLSHFWSLAIEEQFYLFWPVLVYLLNARSLGWVCLLFILSSLALRNIYFGVESASLYTYTATFARLDALGIGVLLAILLSINKTALERLFLPLFRICGITLLLGIALFYSFSYLDEFFVRAGFTLLAFFFGSLLLMTISNHPGNFWRELFSSRFFRWFGKYSYGLYVIHYPVHHLMEMYVYAAYPAHFTELYTKAGLAVAGLAITIPLAFLSYRFLELPFLRLKRFFV